MMPDKDYLPRRVGTGIACRLSLLCAITLCSGCAAVAVGSAAVSVGGAVVSTGATVVTTGVKATGAAVNAVVP